MRYLAALLLLAAIATPAAAQREVNVSGDPVGNKPNGWASASDPSVTFASTGFGQLQLGNFGGNFNHALGVSGVGTSLLMHFTTPAVAISGSFQGQPGSRYTFRAFLYGTKVGEQVDEVAANRDRVVSIFKVAEGFNRLEITKTRESDAESEAFRSFVWYTQSDLDAEAAAVAPEPASMALLGTGLAGLAGAARRRRQRKQGAAE